MSTIPALIVTLLCAGFAFLVWQEYARHQRLSHLFWMVSLAASALASLAYCLTLWTAPHGATWFFIYYLFGAMWMPSLMGLGSLALAFSKKWTYGVTVAVLVIGLIGSVLFLTQPYSVAALHALDGGAGTGVIHPGAWLAPLITLNTFGAAAVVGVALWSAWKFIKNRSLGRFFYGNVALAVGVIIISSAGSAARLGAPQLFWVVMLIGWLVTFVGYRWLTPRRRAAEAVAVG